MTDADKAFLARFAPRGWMAADREDADEEAICKRGKYAGYLRRTGSEYHFTPAGLSALLGD